MDQTSEKTGFNGANRRVQARQPRRRLESVSIPEPTTKVRLSRLQIRAGVYGAQNRRSSDQRGAPTFVAGPGLGPQNLEEEEEEETPTWPRQHPAGGATTGGSSETAAPSRPEGHRRQTGNRKNTSETSTRPFAALRWK